jgi:rhamnulose-1-phosphate aldolase/alcohol dehydrogenase
MLTDRWDASRAPQDAVGLLVYRSNLLGSDRSLANWGGGNTSAKGQAVDHRGRTVEVMWVKGSGSDLASAGPGDFVALRLEDLRELEARESMEDEELVEYLGHCVLHPGSPRPSIETMMHAFLPFAHVDHTHPDAILALATAADGEDWARRVFGERVIWQPYRRPGFGLAKAVAQAVRRHPQAQAVILDRHGLVTWGDTSRECYARTLAVVGEAEDAVRAHARGRAILASPVRLGQREREELLQRALPVVRGLVGDRRRMVLAVDVDEDTLSFTADPQAAQVADRGSACPDHLVHTRPWPLWVAWDPQEGADRLEERLREGMRAYAQRYQAYFEAHRGRAQTADVLEHPYPRVVVLPHVGVVTTGRDAAMAEVARDLYRRAIAVMRGAETLSRFTSLSEQDAFDVEYWPLELYKLTRRPPDRELSGRVALITGGASGIGRATAHLLAREGAHVVILDQNAQEAEGVAEAIRQAHGRGRAMAVAADVSSEEQVRSAFAATVRAYGGVDIVVNNAGFAHAAAVEDTELDAWRRVFAVMVDGYFLVAREAFRIFKAQGIGGSLIFVASKNAVQAGKNNAAYSAAKASELHLARCLAEEGGEYGIRVNTVLPDAVLRGSSIWDTSWREERAKAYGIAPQELEDFYRRRTALRTNILPEDVAQAIAFFASDRSAKTTGGALTVDGGVSGAYLR